MHSCHNCIIAGHICQVGEDLNKCTSCIQSDCFCDLVISSAVLKQVYLERVKLWKQVKEACKANTEACHTALKTDACLSHLKQQLELVKNKKEQLMEIKWQNIAELKQKESVKTTFSLKLPFNVESEHLNLSLDFNWFHLTSFFGGIVSGGPDIQSGS